MVNFSLNAGSLMGIILVFGGTALYFLRSFRPNLARDYDVFFAAIALLCGGILFFQSWRLDPILQFGVFLLSGSAVFFAADSIRLRKIATEQAKRTTPIVDEDRPVSRSYQYQAELDDEDDYGYDSFEERQPISRRIRGSRDSRPSDYDQGLGQQDSYRRSSRSRRSPGYPTQEGDDRDLNGGWDRGSSPQDDRSETWQEPSRSRRLSPRDDRSPRRTQGWDTWDTESEDSGYGDDRSDPDRSSPPNSSRTSSSRTSSSRTSSSTGSGPTSSSRTSSNPTSSSPTGPSRTRSSRSDSSEFSAAASPEEEGLISRRAPTATAGSSRRKSASGSRRPSAKRRPPSSVLSRSPYQSSSERDPEAPSYVDYQPVAPSEDEFDNSSNFDDD